MGKNRINQRANPNREFWQIGLTNNSTYMMYYNQLMNLGVNSFKYTNLPDSVDPRFLELYLMAKGYILFFKDEELERYLCLPCTLGPKWDVYNIPIHRKAFATNGYHADRTISNSVLIYNNYLRQPDIYVVRQYAMRLYEIQRTVDTNVKAQKTPVMILAPENKRLSMVNVYKQYEGNEPFIFAEPELTPNSIRSISTGAPFVGRDLNDLKHELYNEALTYFGINNVSTVKRERLITDEITRNLGGVNAMRNVRLDSRLQGIDKINKMFGLNIGVEFNSDMDIITDDFMSADFETNEGGDKGE